MDKQVSMYTINVTLQFTLLTPGIAGSRYQLLFTIFCETIFFLEMSKVVTNSFAMKTDTDLRLNNKV